MAEKYLDPQKGIFAIHLNPIMIAVLSGIICILFLSSYSNIVNGKDYNLSEREQKNMQGK